MSPSRSRRVEIAVVALLLLGGLALRLALARDYVFAGTDSYGYVHLADEWRTHGRYALSPTEPLYYGRTPGYAAFIALVKGDARADQSGGAGWTRIVVAQGLVDLCVTGLLAWAMARRLGGRVAGAIALGLALYVPFGLFADGAALSESLATALTVLAVAPLVLCAQRPRLAFSLSGVAAALCTLVRPDGILVLFAWAPAVLRLPTWRARVIASSVAVAAFAIAFAPWPARNLVRFGKAWPVGTRVNRFQQPIEHWQGAHHFMQSYGFDWRGFNDGTRCYFDGFCSDAELIAVGAVENGEDRKALGALLAKQRREGLSPAVDAAYEELARERRARHPISSRLWLPLRRAAVMWFDGFDEVYQKPPLRPLYDAVKGAIPPLMALSTVLLLVGALGLATVGERERLGLALVLLVALGGRTAVLAWEFYCMPRYVREVMPLGYVVAACGLVAWARWLARRRSARMHGSTGSPSGSRKEHAA